MFYIGEEMHVLLVVDPLNFKTFYSVFGIYNVVENKLDIFKVTFLTNKKIK